MKSISEAVEREQQSIKKQNYTMSIRELKSMYNEELINLEPKYQRMFRWDENKASKLIESIFLGIPLPPIYISVRGGKWDIVDGIQRISSILWFCGVLNSDREDTKVPLKLKNLEKIRELNEMQLSDIEPDEVFKYFYMNRLDVVLLTSENTESEYELFNRLNSGGVKLSAQEIRNFLIVKSNLELSEKMINIIRKNETFKKVVSLSDNQIKENYDMELLVYCLIIRFAIENIAEFQEISTKYKYSRDRFIDNSIKKVLEKPFEVNEEIEKMNNIFQNIYNELGESSFKKGNKFSPLIYIILLAYLYKNKKSKSLVEIKSKVLKSQEYKEASKRGKNVVDQFMEGLKIGMEI